jgi:hypothetical protein
MEKIPTNEEVSRIAEQLHGLIKPLKSSNVFELLGIYGKELPLSNYMAHLFDSQRDHGCGTIFFEVLIRLIESKLPKQNGFLKRIQNDSYQVRREKNNIDILVNDEDNKWAIIIENKVNHVLNNDFDRYSKSTNTKNYLIVVIGLKYYEKPTNVDTDRFCCITYRELMNAISKVHEDSLLNFSNETETYLFNQWVAYMKKLNNTKVMKKEEIPFLKFYEENLNSIKIITQAPYIAEKIIKKATEEIMEVLFNFSIYEKGSIMKGFSFYASDEFYKTNEQYDDQLKFEINTEKLFEKHKIILSLELNYNKVYLYSQELSDQLKALDKTGFIEIDYETKQNYACLAKTQITFKSISNYREELINEIKVRFIDSGIFQTALDKVIIKANEIDK